MPPSYSHRSVLVSSLLGILSAVVSVLSVLLLFQLRSQQQQTGRESAPPRDASPVPARVWDLLPPVCTVLTALSLTLHLSAVVVCLLHSYCATEICRGEQDTERADWFLLESRAVRHVAMGLFCVGVAVFLAALSIYTLLVFQLETGIASACILSSGVLILLMVVVHSLVKSYQTSGLDRPPLLNHHHTLFHNMHGGVCGAPLPGPGELKAVDQPRAHGVPSQMHRQMSYPPPKQPDPPPDRYSPARGSQQGYAAGDKDGYSSGGSSSRMHRTLSTELLQAPTKPWNGVNNEMRSVLARKSGVSGKDSTLV